MIYIPIRNVVSVATGKNITCNRHQVYEFIPMLLQLISIFCFHLVLFSFKTTTWIQLNSSLLVTPFLLTVSTKIYGSRNYLLLQFLISSMITFLFHLMLHIFHLVYSNHHSIPLNQGNSISSLSS